MLIQHMSELRPEGLGDEGGRDEDVRDLMQLYRASKVRFDAEEDFKTRARERVTQLQGGEWGCQRGVRREGLQEDAYLCDKRNGMYVIKGSGVWESPHFTTGCINSPRANS